MKYILAIAVMVALGAGTAVAMSNQPTIVTTFKPTQPTVVATFKTTLPIQGSSPVLQGSSPDLQ